MPYPLRVSSQRPPGWTRAVVALSAGLPLVGCLVEAPPEFEEPPRTAPVLSIEQAVPPVNAPLEVERDGPPISITVPLFWDGSGGPLRARLFLDLNTDRAEQVEDPVAAIPPEIQASWLLDPRVSPGCHQLTLIVTHADNYPDLLVPKPIDPTLAASITWWVAVDVAAADLSLADCSARALGER